MSIDQADPRSQQPPIFANVRKVASSLNTYTDPQDILDTESPDVLNAVFDRGYPTPRTGSVIAWTKPAGETNALLNLINCVTSNRKEYPVAIYAPNIYLRDEVNNQWIPINGAYTPSAANKALPYGYQIWNSGAGNDFLYFGNGTEDTIKWQICLSYLSANAGSGDATLTLSSAVQFPSSGTLVIMGNAGAFTVAYLSKSGNTLSLSSAVGQAVGAGAAVTVAIQDMGQGLATSSLTATTGTGDTTIALMNASGFPASGSVVIQQDANTFSAPIAYTSISGNTLSLGGTAGGVYLSGSKVGLQVSAVMPKGKIFAKSQGRLFIGNSSGAETTMWYSNVNSPETYSIGSDPSSGGFYGFIEGLGEITGIFDFGLYLGILKGDSFHRFEFVIDSTNTTKIDQVTPLVNDDSLGCPYFKQWVKKNTTLYYPSLTSGIFSIAPVVTGYQTTIQLQVLDLNIHNLYQSLNFATGRSAAFQTKIFWACSTATAVDTILVYDTLRQYWTKFNNWPVADWLTHAGNLYFGSYQDGNVYKCFDSSNTDNNTPYSSYVYTKRYDFATPSMPKTMSRLFVQGYMNSSTNLYCDVLFNEMGTQQKLTYLIKGNQPYVVQPITPALAQAMLGIPIFGASSLDSLNGVGLFKVYLALPNRYGFFNIQFKFYTQGANAGGSNWSVTGIGMNPQMVAKAPENLVIDTTGSVPVPTPTVSKQ